MALDELVARMFVIFSFRDASPRIIVAIGKVEEGS